MSVDFKAILLASVKGM